MPKDGLSFSFVLFYFGDFVFENSVKPARHSKCPSRRNFFAAGDALVFCGLFRPPDALLVDRGSLNTERVGQDVLISEGKKEEFRGFVFVFVKFHFHILLSFLRDSERSRDRLSRILHTLRGGEAGATGLRRLSHPRSMPRDGRYPFAAPRFHPCR